MTLETKNNTLEAVKNTSAFAWTKDDDQIAWLTIDVPNEKNEYIPSRFC